MHFSNNDNNNNANTNMFMIMIMNMNTNNVGGRSCAPGGRNKAGYKAKTRKGGDESSPSNLLNAMVKCTLKWLAKSSWHWSQRSKTLESQMLALLLALNVKAANSMSVQELHRFLLATEFENELQICHTITKGIKTILTSFDGV